MAASSLDTLQRLRQATRSSPKSRTSAVEFSDREKSDLQKLQQGERWTQSPIWEHTQSPNWQPSASQHNIPQAKTQDSTAKKKRGQTTEEYNFAKSAPIMIGRKIKVLSPKLIHPPEVLQTLSATMLRKILPCQGIVPQSKDLQDLPLGITH
jgi:hypothetical protein